MAPEPVRLRRGPGTEGRHLPPAARNLIALGTDPAPSSVGAQRARLDLQELRFEDTPACVSSSRRALAAPRAAGVGDRRAEPVLFGTAARNCRRRAAPDRALDCARGLLPPVAGPAAQARGRARAALPIGRRAVCVVRRRPVAPSRNVRTV